MCVSSLLLSSPLISPLLSSPLLSSPLLSSPLLCLGAVQVLSSPGSPFMNHDFVVFYFPTRSHTPSSTYRHTHTHTHPPPHSHIGTHSTLNMYNARGVPFK